YRGFARWLACSITTCCLLEKVITSGAVHSSGINQTDANTMDSPEMLLLMLTCRSSCLRVSRRVIHIESSEPAAAEHQTAINQTTPSCRKSFHNGIMLVLLQYSVMQHL
ncbi:hypothetical protein B0H10DRAFT_2077209, partial [Mycena sp. CBHHK59/15]